MVDIGHPYGRVLELGTRLGVQFVTVRAGEPADDPAEFFARLAEFAARYHLRPLLSLAAGTVATLEQAAATVAGTGGGVVLDVVPGREDAVVVDETVVEPRRPAGLRPSAGPHARAHRDPGAARDAPPQVPVAIGGVRPLPTLTNKIGQGRSRPHPESPGPPRCAPRSTPSAPPARGAVQPRVIPALRSRADLGSVSRSAR